METLYPTSAGLNYAAQTAAGKVLIFTRGKFGNGVRTTETISTLSELINPLGEMPISKKSVSDSTVMVTTQFSNQVDGALLDTFYLSEVGLYAKLQSEDGTDDEDYPETLVAYAYDNPGDKIPGTVLTEFIFNFPLTVAEASNVDVEISSMAYTTQEDFDAEVEARAAADTTLQMNIETEATTRESVDEELQASLDAHTAGDSPADDTTSEAAPAHGGTVTMVDGVTRDDAGHVLSVNTKTVTLPSDENTDTKVTQTNTTTNANYRLLLSYSASDTTSTTTSRKSTNFKANPSTGVLTAPTFSGNLTGNVTGDVTGNADTATTATSATSADTAAKLGSDTVGGAAKPIYLSSGAPTACSSTVGSATKHMYMSSGTMMASSSTVGSGTKPIYMSSGTFTASSSTVGDANTPVYMSSGTITAGNNIKNYATYVVAASNSVGKKNADYVCDGENDEEEIYAAIKAIYSTSIHDGGKIILLEGVYNISSSISLGSPYTNVTIEGMTNSGRILWILGNKSTGPELKFTDGVDSLFTANNYIHATFKNINFVGTVEHGIVSMSTGEVTFENCSARISVTGEEATAIVEGSSVELPSTSVVDGSVVNFLGANYFLITYEDNLDICAAMLRTVYVNGGGCFIDCTINGTHDNSVFYNCRGEFHDSTILGADTVCSQTPLNIHDCYMDCMRPSGHYVYNYGSFCNNRIVINDGSYSSNLYMAAAQISGNRINCNALNEDLTIYARMFNGNMLYDNASYPPILYNAYMSVIGNQWRYEPTITASTSVSSGNLEYISMSKYITD